MFPSIIVYHNNRAEFTIFKSTLPELQQLHNKISYYTFFLLNVSISLSFPKKYNKAC